MYFKKNLIQKDSCKYRNWLDPNAKGKNMLFLRRVHLDRIMVWLSLAVFMLDICLLLETLQLICSHISLLFLANNF